jgi:hypothetical protein
MVGMARGVVVALGLVGVVSLFAAAAVGCTSTGSSPGAPDGAAMTPDGQGDSSTEASDTSACTAAGGKCVVGGAFCSGIGSQDCPMGAYCCLGPPVCTDANVQLIQAANYDQSCTTDSDCIAVGLGNACFGCEIGCPNAAISRSSQAQYRSDVADSPANGADCGCPIFPSGPCCVGGLCEVGSQCGNASPAGDAAADTGADAGTDGATEGGPTDASGG